jgi:sugar/nucleoside kinase (ribokinase family)
VPPRRALVAVPLELTVYTPLADRKFDVAGLGNALVDALVRMDDVDFLVSHGLHRGRMTPVDHSRWQDFFQEIQEHGVEIQSGGSCGNTIAGLGFLGASAIYAGQVGDDQMGHLYAARMNEACGQHSLRWSRKTATGKCLSIVSTKDAERTMLTDLGAAVTMDGLGEFDNVIRSSRVVHITGYLLLGEPMASRAEEAMAIGVQEQIPVSLDVADPFVVHTVRDRMWHAIEELVDIVFMNEEEAVTLAGGAGVEVALARVAEVCDTVVLKLGSRGSVVVHKGQRVEVGVHPVQAVDTTGAGDAYAAGFLYGYIQGWDARRSADLGARIASMTVGQVGAVVRDRDRMLAAIAATLATP